MNARACARDDGVVDFGMRALSFALLVVSCSLCACQTNEAFPLPDDGGPPDATTSDATGDATLDAADAGDAADAATDSGADAPMDAAPDAADAGDADA